MKTITTLLLLLAGIQSVEASHLLGGYIQVKPASGSLLTYDITIGLYLDNVYGTAAASQQNSVTVCFGDGVTGVANRQSQLLVLNKTTSLNMYKVTHTYTGAGTYAIRVGITNRTQVLNIDQASFQLFVLNTTISTNTTAANQTPMPGVPESGFHIGINQRVTLSLKATDAEGDSLVYGLARPITAKATDVCERLALSSYQFPNDITHQGTFKLNNRPGELVWDAPVKPGLYSAALTIDEYRNGILISQTTQEIPLFVDDLPGTPTTMPAYEPAIEGAIVTGIIYSGDPDMSLTTFPNPVDDGLQVIIQSSNPTTATIQLLDVNGRKLHELAFTKPARTHEQFISMDSLSAGVYLLRANVGDRVLVRKIVKR
ncbi:T9SS type A sorting domain-containing protein [Spirosoma koreense]